MRIRLVATFAALLLAAGAGAAAGSSPFPSPEVSCPVGTFPVLARKTGTPTLRSAAKGRGMAFGAAVDLEALRNEQAYRDVLAREFSMLVPENELKMRNTRPAQEVFDFCDADQVVGFAQANGLKVRGTPLVWHRSLPAWLVEGTWTRDELVAILRDHVTTTVTHYKGVVSQWDVVNEPVSDDGTGLRHSIWYDVIGPEYIDLAFEFAHEADPAAKLFVNEYGAEQAGTRHSTLLALMRSLRARGVPVDGVGLQSHVSGSGPGRVAVREAMAPFASLGLLVAVTEADVGADPNRLRTDRRAALATQANAWHGLLDGCLDTMRACTTFMAWGFTDAHTWRAAEEPLPFDASYAPKPAYDSLLLRLLW
jgi:endo-1,4-beta-xylanase